jgi:hypothetical protein
VSSAQAVPLGVDIPEIAAVDVDVAVETGVAAGRGISHGPGTALCAVEAEAGSDTLEGRLWLCGTGSKSAALSSARCAASSDDSAASASVASVVVVARLRCVAAAVGCVDFDVGGCVLEDALPFIADLLVGYRRLVVDSSPGVLLQHAVEQFLYCVGSASEIIIGVMTQLRKFMCCLRCKN